MKKFVIGIILGLSSVDAWAQNIVYTFSGIGTGSFSGAAFTNAAFTINVYANVEDIAADPPLFEYYVEDIRSEFEISGVGSGEFLNDERVFVADNVLGISHGASLGESPGPLEILDLISDDFMGYDLSGDFGPVTVTGAGTAIFAFEQFINEPTTGGALTFTNVSSVTFSATVIPEPSGALLGLASGSALVWRRRRKTALETVR